MSKSGQVSSDSSLDSSSTHASSIEYSNIRADNQNSSADHASNNSGNDPTPLSSFPASLASSQSLLSLSDPLNCFIADLPMDMFQPIPLSTFSSDKTGQQQQVASTQQYLNSSTGVENVSINFQTTKNNNMNMDKRSQHQNAGFMGLSAEPSAPNSISDEAVAQIVSNSSVPEFLYQLTKMLTDDHRDIIEWSNAKIEVHNPHRLESEVLNKYFRHSKYASFQRQLNYFGFRKLAGKGKMAPCSYVNENATNDLRSLLRMKRKTSATTAKDAKEKKLPTAVPKENKVVPPASLPNPATTKSTSGVKRTRDSSNNYVSVGPVAKIAVGKGVRHQLNGYLRNNNTKGITSSGTTVSSSDRKDQSPGTELPKSLDPFAIAKAAVGKGISHQFSIHNKSASCTISNQNNPNSARFTNVGPVKAKQQVSSSNQFTFLDPSQLGMDIESSLCELQNNYQNSLNEVGDFSDYNDDFFSKTGLRRESSLVALAMIPSLSSIEPTPVSELQEVEGGAVGNIIEDMDDDKGMMSFMDFPG